jgi:3'-phosphoadenosine 5'-phosphosulfate sulfotransferase (PAPS reductase)/FAD synthetase
VRAAVPGHLEALEAEAIHVIREVAAELERYNGRMFERDGMLYRTVEDMTCTGAVRSSAATLDEVVAEIAATRIAERGATRADDRVSEAAMEDRKREGYF